MTAHNSGKTRNSRNESSNRTANTVWTPAKARMLAKVVNLQKHAGRPTTAGTLLKSEMTAAAGTIGTSWMSSAVGPPDDSRKVSNSRGDSNIQQGH